MRIVRVEEQTDKMTGEILSITLISDTGNVTHIPADMNNTVYAKYIEHKESLDNS